MSEIAPTPPEFSRIVSLSKLERGPLDYNLTAKPAERAALAKRFGLPALHEFTAEVHLAREISGVRLDATIHAELEQICSVTLEPFRSSLTDQGTLHLRRNLATPDAIEPAEEDEDLLKGEEIDVGEAVAQQLSLALDPYPRAPGVEVGKYGEEAEPDRPTDAKPHPFAALGRLVKK